MFLYVTVVYVDIIVYAVAPVEQQIGTPGVFINVTCYISNHSPIAARGEAVLLLGQGFPLTWLGGGEGVVPVGERYPERGSAVDSSSAVHDATMAAAVAQTVADGKEPARCHRGRHILQDVQRGVIHALVVVLIVELLRPYSLRGLPDVHP